LPATLAAIVCAVLCGARGYAGIAEWIAAQPVAVWHLLGFTRRPPTRNCFRDLLLALSPQAVEEALEQWIRQVLEQALDETTLQAVALDGKSLCGTMQPYGRVIQLLAALDQQTGCVLSQQSVPGTTNEHKTALEVLKTLVLEGRIITGDAAFCQRDVCQAVIDSGGHYVFSVKENQPELLREIASELAANDAAFFPLPAASAC
jgi:hypothetical protein